MYSRRQPHHEGFWGISKRAVFVLDRDGVVRYSWITEDALVEPNVDDVLAALENVARPAR
jgi:peroxiredoxin